MQQSQFKIDLRYLFVIFCLQLLIIEVNAQHLHKEYEDFICDYDWMYTQPDVYNSGRSHYDWFKRCIEFENQEVNDQSAAHGSTALHTAAGLGDLAAIRYLIEQGADIEVFDFQLGYTPLHEAVSSGESGAVRMLLDAGANVNAKIYSKRYKHNNGKSALHISVFKLDVIVTRILLRIGARVNSLDQNKDTPLNYLLKTAGWSISEREKFDELEKELRFSEICKLLVNAGVSTVKPNKQGRSSKDIAKELLEDEEAFSEVKVCARIVLSK